MRQMPATRIGRTVIFPGGETVILSQWERLMFKLGVRKTMRPTAARVRASAWREAQGRPLRWWEYPW